LIFAAWTFGGWTFGTLMAGWWILGAEAFGAFDFAPGRAFAAPVTEATGSAPPTGPTSALAA